MDEPIRRILIIKPSALGDIVHGLPVLHGLRVVHPEAHIAWMVSPAYGDILRGHRELNEIFEFDRKYFGRFGRAWGPTRDFLRWAVRLARARFDLVVDLQGLFRSGFFTLLSRAPLRFGFSGARECGWLFYNRRVRASDGAVHAVDRNYQFAGPLGFAHVEPTFELPIDCSSRKSARLRLAEAGLDPDRPYAVLVPGSVWASKRWPADRFARICDYLRGRGLNRVLVGSADEREVAGAVRLACGVPPADLVGRTNLKELAALLERAAVVVTNDSGPMHMAAALGRPMVAIFGPTDPARTGPYRRPDAVVRAVHDRRHHFRHDDLSAIAAATVEMVVRVLELQLAGPARPAGRSTDLSAKQDAPARV